MSKILKYRYGTALRLFFLYTALDSQAHAEMGKEYATPHEGWDLLWWTLMLDIVIIGVIFAAITLYLLVKYKRKGLNDVGTAKPLNALASFGWVFIPVFVFMADDVFLGLENMKHWLDFRRPPADALTVDMEAYMWGYEVKYPEGITLQNELRVPAGKPVRVNLTSRDVIHTLFIPDLRTKWDALPGTGLFLWFHPQKAGDHVMTCTEYCGMLHSSMYGKIIAMPEGEFTKWVEARKPRSQAPAEQTELKPGGES
ncbi:MAG: hypothetical protein HZA01_08825 [Nitrospinae bacterium]|nr:hypothetical protein [Nitrospinota bacterium]